LGLDIAAADDDLAAVDLDRAVKLAVWRRRQRADKGACETVTAQPLTKTMKLCDWPIMTLWLLMTFQRVVMADAVLRFSATAMGPVVADLASSCTRPVGVNRTHTAGHAGMV